LSPQNTTSHPPPPIHIYPLFSFLICHINNPSSPVIFFILLSSLSDFFVEKRSRDLVGGQTSDGKKTLEKKHHHMNIELKFSSCGVAKSN
jgi:hypothetical protein